MVFQVILKKQGPSTATVSWRASSSSATSSPGAEAVSATAATPKSELLAMIQVQGMTTMRSSSWLSTSALRLKTQSWEVSLVVSVVVCFYSASVLRAEFGRFCCCMLLFGLCLERYVWLFLLLYAFVRTLSWEVCLVVVCFCSDSVLRGEFGCCCCCMLLFGLCLERWVRLLLLLYAFVRTLSWEMSLVFVSVVVWCFCSDSVFRGEFCCCHLLLFGLWSYNFKIQDF